MALRSNLFSVTAYAVSHFRLKRMSPGPIDGWMSRTAPPPSALLRMLAPFVLATVLSFALVAATTAFEALQFAVAIVLTIGVIASIAWLPWNRLPRFAQLWPPMLFLVAAGFLRASGGGAQSGVAAIALLPAFWLALHGPRRQLAIVLAGVAFFFLAPILFIGGAAYPASGYRSTVMFVVIASIVCFTTQGLVHKVRRQAAEVARHTRDLQRVAAISREIATSLDARLRVCEAACELASGAFAFLMEPDGAGGLVSTTMAGLDAPEVLSNPRGPAITTFEAAEPLFLADAGSRPELDKARWQRLGSPASMLFQPVLRAGVPVGVLVIGWAERTPAGRRASIISLLSGEAAFAINTADLVERLTGLATVDSLTGVLNRRGWDLQVEHVFADAGNHPVCVALLDLDHFKAFNDSHGHQSGDRLLKEAAAGWRDSLRAGDVLARYGGEEFALLLPACDLDQAEVIVDRLRAATPGAQTCSAGIAVWDGREHPDALIRRADDALYAAKAAGRDRATVAA
jgi:diguanylate cyclase (GGDEF)-like protein